MTTWWHSLAILHVAPPSVLWLLVFGLKSQIPLAVSTILLFVLPAPAGPRLGACSGLGAFFRLRQDVLNRSDRGYGLRVDMIRSARMKKPCAYVGSVSPP
jgi:hypothetical protein